MSWALIAYHWREPESVEAGRYLVTVSGTPGPEDFAIGASFMQLPEGLSLEDARAEEGSGEEIPAFFYESTFAGGVAARRRLYGFHRQGNEAEWKAQPVKYRAPDAADCGGCHAHSQKPSEFKHTLAGQDDYKVWDLVNTTPVVTAKKAGLPAITRQRQSNPAPRM